MRHLAERGLTNYWGYSPLAWLAPHAGYATGCLGQQLREVKSMVRALHRAGIEVLLDVVLNHSAEGDHNGPTLSLRGIDNRSYYRLDRDDPSRYLDTTGCGNTLDLAREPGRRLALECLRYWASAVRVDGFRFDLATCLGREERGFSARARLLREIEADPLLSGLKLIAEPWDLGAGGYRLGEFPAGWAEWNDRTRDTVRRFWRGESGQAPELRRRLAGSPDLFPAKARGALASVNYVTSHDGFTLADLVAYEHKHNEGNGEGNHDGPGLNWSRNWGREGDTEDAAIRAVRERVRRSLLATVVCCRGVPMLLAGDELGRTQRGNNNAYCQDNTVSWLDWRLDPERGALLDFTTALLATRRAIGALGAENFPPSPGPLWFGADGAWLDLAGAAEPRDGPPGPACGVVLGGDAGGRPRWLLLLNPSADGLGFILPAAAGRAGRELVHTGRVPAAWNGGPVDLPAHSLVVLELLREPPP